MSVVILHPPDRPRPPYPQWLARPGTELVLVTGPSAGPTPSGYADVRAVTGYATSARVETTVLELAETRRITAIVAIDAADQIRAGGLRDHLRLPGLSRDTAIGLVDAMRSHELLAGAGVAVIARGGVRRAVDLFWFAHRWGYPLRLRSRRRRGWPTVTILRHPAELREFCERSLPVDHSLAPDLVVEPQVPGERQRAVFSLEDDRDRVTGTALAGTDLTETAVAALVAVGAVPGWPHQIDLIGGGDGAWLIDTITADPLDPGPDPDSRLRAIVRVQVGRRPALAKVI